jgi:catechol 2,3-dioxygenase-like lactoylglutathione lyase family enzyme
VFDHVSLNVRDFAASREFYTRALEPRGRSGTRAASAYSRNRRTSGSPNASRSAPASMSPFAADDRATVDAFHAAALAAGGTDNGAPGIRENYHSNYYGAFVLDPDGNNVEAVCHNG